MATNDGEDWLKTPGIAHRSVREMQVMDMKKRMGKFCSANYALLPRYSKRPESRMFPFKCILNIYEHVF